MRDDPSKNLKRLEQELLAAEDLKADMLCQKANDFVIANAKAVAKAEKAADAE